MIKLIAFDWNGTIFADTAAILDGVNAVLKLFKLKQTTLEYLQQIFDVPVSKSYSRLGVPIEQSAKNSALVAKTFHTFYEQRATKIRTRANVRQLLEWADKNNIKSIIFSNHIDEQIKKQLKRLRIENYFSAVLANSHITAALDSRYKKDKLQAFLKDNNILPTEALIIGDTVEEIEIGKELGSPTVAITDGNCSTARLKAAKPDYLINNLKEVIEIIKIQSS